LLSQIAPPLKQVEYVGIESDCRHSGRSGPDLHISITEGKRRVKESRNQEQKISERNCSIKKQLIVEY
jgi:hypothetical protein